MKHLELSNVNGLDESIMNAVGMTDNLEYSSCCGADGDNYSNNVGEILTNVSTSLQSGDLGGKGTATGGGSGSTGGGKAPPKWADVHGGPKRGKANMLSKGGEKWETGMNRGVANQIW